MRIVWTKDEKRAIKDCMIDICYVTPTMSNKGLLQHAQQEVIPYERRQKITDQKVFSHKLMINEARAAAEKHRQAVSKPKPAPTPPPVVTPEPIAPPTFEATLGGIFEQLVDAITERVMLQVTTRLKDRLTGDVSVIAEQRMNELFSDPTEELDRIFDRMYPPKPNAPRLPTCLVVGLNGAQMESIRQRVKGVNFKFLSAEEAVSHCASAKDHTVLMTKFINHSCQNKYRKHPNLHYCNGGVSELNTLLNVIFTKETA
jgi:hypothetical protein